MSDIASYSQTLSQTLKGTVTDKETRMHLTGANILEINSTPPNGTVTDAGSKFSLITGIGRITIKISYLGYEDLIIPIRLSTLQKNFQSRT